MSFRESITSAVTRYYVFNGLFREGEEQMTFETADAYLIEVSQTLESEFAGTARAFTVELDTFDEETHQTEIIVGFTIWPYEDDESEEALIVSSVRDELEKVGFVRDDDYYLGDGPDIR
ncbi:MAG: hypothetical protein JSV04_00800 [Candidatus Heimdallarchaeota archaeon]|nr:MAG: hypothetical protein JSV04_00800 [Candidatus Heimdallarchaeota archaeon]